MLRTSEQFRQQKRLGPHLTIHTMLNFNFSLALQNQSHVLHIIASKVQGYNHVCSRSSPIETCKSQL